MDWTKWKYMRCDACGYEYDETKHVPGEERTVEKCTEGFGHLEFSAKELEDGDTFWVGGQYVKANDFLICPKCDALKTGLEKIDKEK